MQRVRSICLVGFATVLLPLIPSCGSADVLSPVKGRVAYKGAPIRTGTIVFTPDASRGTTGPLSRGEVQSDGTYSLLTGDQSGAAPGWYRVTIAALESLPTTEGRQPAAIPRSLLPEKYRDPELSGLAREIKAGEVNQIDFDLE